MLMRDGWLKAADMVGLQSGKIAEVKAGVGALRRISQVRLWPSWKRSQLCMSLKKAPRSSGSS